ncbi:hypothetical protein PDN38_20875 [Bacillus cereus]|nr:hypothetical protein [Bacillus cereus]
MIDSIIGSIKGFLFDMFKSGVKSFLEMIAEFFRKILDTVGME